MPLRKRVRRQRSKPGDLRVWNIVNPPSDPVYHPVKDVDHACRLIKALAESQLLIDSIDANVFGLEVFESVGWVDWENEDGSSIESVIDQERRLHEIKHKSGGGAPSQ